MSLDTQPNIPMESIYAGCVERDSSLLRKNIRIVRPKTQADPIACVCLCGYTCHLLALRSIHRVQDYRTCQLFIPTTIPTPPLPLVSAPNQRYAKGII